MEEETITKATSSKILPFWQTEIAVVLALCFFWPVGIFLMWRYAPWKKVVKTIVTTGIVGWFTLSSIVVLLMILAISRSFFTDNFLVGPPMHDSIGAQSLITETPPIKP